MEGRTQPPRMSAQVLSFVWSEGPVSRPERDCATPCLNVHQKIMHTWFMSSSCPPVDWRWPWVYSATACQGEDSQHSSLFRERYRPSQIGSRLSLEGNHFSRRFAILGMITVVIASETWQGESGWGWVFFFCCFFSPYTTVVSLCFDQLDWSNICRPHSHPCVLLHFMSQNSPQLFFSGYIVHLMLTHLRAFLISNGSCAMMPIMSVAQQGGDNPSFGREDEFTHCVWMTVVCCLPHHLSVFVWRVLALCSFQVSCLGPCVWLTLSSLLFSLFLSDCLSLTLSSLAFCQPSQNFQLEWCCYSKNPSILACHAKPCICLLGSPPNPFPLPPPFTSSSSSSHTSTPGSLKTGSVSC